MTVPRPADPALDHGASKHPEHDGSTWEREVADYLSFRAVEAPVGPVWFKRLDWELHRVPRLFRRLRQTPPGSILELKAEHLAAMRSMLPWEKPTFCLHFAALRQFARWAKNPIAEQKVLWSVPSGETSHRRWLTGDQLSTLFSHSEGRSRLLVALEAFNGLRRVEVLRLRVRDVLTKERTLRVLGKGRNGGKWRQIPMHPMVEPLLVEALKDKWPDDRLFPLSLSGADLLMQRAVERAGFRAAGVRISHHDLRRTFGRLAHEAGMDLVQLKNLFGHASIEMTVHYIGLDADRMREGLERLRLGNPSPPSRGPSRLPAQGAK